MIRRPPTHYIVGDDGEVEQLVAPDGIEDMDLRPLPEGFHDRHVFQWHWSADDQEWQENIVGEQSRIWGDVKAQRDALLIGGCEVPNLGWVQTNAASLAAIDRLVTAALADPTGWSDVFTMADNTDEPVDHDAMLSIKAAVVAHEQAIRSAARDVRDALYDEEVVNLDQLYAIPTDLEAILSA